MATLSTSDKIHLIQFLDFLCTSILMASVPPTILKTGATLIHLGVFMSISSAVRMLSVTFTTELLKIFQKQEIMRHYLKASLLLNIALYMTTSVNGILLNRMIYVVVNQATMFCGQSTNKGSKDVKIYEKLHVQMLVAALLGSAIVGSYIDMKGGFYTLVVISTVISGIQLALSHQLEDENDSKEKQLKFSSAIVVVPKTFNHVFKTIREIDVHFGNWDALLINSLLISNAKVVFILYVVLIMFVFGGNGALVCTTSAYQTVAISLSGWAYTKLNDQVVKHGNSQEILEKSSLFCGFCALIMGLSPSYILYLLAFIPFIIFRTFVQSYFRDVFEVTKNQKLKKDIETTSAITEIFCPLFIVVVFQLLLQNAYRILAVAPFIAIYYIAKNKTTNQKYKKESKQKRNIGKVEKNKDK